MKNHIKCSVVMLATENKQNNQIVKHIYNDDNKLSIKYEEMYEHGDYVGQHLYILSDEKIKEGDWCLITNHLINKPIQIESFKDNEVVFSSKEYIILNQDKEDCKKIIATTNPELGERLDFAGNGGTGEGFAPLLDIPNDFIQHFISEYNKGNVITEVWVEVETQWIKEGKPTLESSGYNEEVFYSQKMIHSAKIKISPDNTITIKPVIDDWDDIHNQFKDCEVPFHRDDKTLIKWLKENYYPPIKK